MIMQIIGGLGCGIACAFVAAYIEGKLAKWIK